MSLYSSRLIYTASPKGTLTDHVISTDDRGVILSIQPLSAYPDQRDIQFLSGIIVPGFINAHCHLELSHMKGMIPTGTGLVEFIRQIVTRRNENKNAIPQAILSADQEMYGEGIVAVGDISNVVDTFDQKNHSKLLYHTFIEAFDLMQAQNARAEFDKSMYVLNQLNCPSGHKKSLVPHATYSVSDTLFDLIRTQHQKNVSTSIHHQETEAENQFIATRTGALVSFFQGFGLNLEQYIPTGKTASSVPIKYMSSDQNTLLVHNTMSTPADIEAIEQWNDQVYWVTCPNANLYIENRLPHYQYWLDRKSKVCIGTDSLASNWHLSILEEIKTIQRYQSYVPLEELILWATMHGAQALGYADALGSIEVNKKPGLVNITDIDFAQNRLTNSSYAIRLI